MGCSLRFGLIGGALALAGCSLLVDSTLEGRDTDAGTSTMDSGSDACAGMEDGTACGSGMVCVSQVCSVSECGDGVVDTAMEQCDDGNDVPLDGCEPSTCEFSCASDEECDDGVFCNGAETCTDDHVCGAEPQPDETECTLPDESTGECRDGACVIVGCGNAMPDFGEECDDGNSVEGDGCDNDCTLSCREDSECDDGDVCNGVESCNTDDNSCVAGETMVCDDEDACTADECDPLRGCFFPLIDADGDGHAPDTLGECGDDCDDMDDEVFEGAEELCDGKDNNCNIDIDEGQPTWYQDCDDDGFAASTDGAVTACDEPPTTRTCAGWTTVRPIDTTNTDCHDGNASVNPGQTTYQSSPYTTTRGGSSFDYNCDGDEALRYGCQGGFVIICSSACGSLRGFVDDGTWCTESYSSGIATFRRPAPECGASGSMSYCAFSLGGGSCYSATRDQTQTCL